MDIKKVRKKLGVGSLSFPLIIVGLLLSMVHFKQGTLGEVLFNKINISIPCGIISIICVIVGFLLGKRYNNDLFAELGKRLAIIVFSLFIFSILLVVVFNLGF